jgi:hypothetical protein
MRWFAMPGTLGMIVLGALAIAVLATAALLLTMRQDEVRYPPDSAEAAFQHYIAAWDEGDTGTAYAALSSRARSLVPFRDFVEAQAWSAGTPTRVWVDERRDVGERVILDLTIEQSWDGPLGPSRDRYQPTVTMLREDGAWKVDTPLVGYHPW